LSAAQAVTHALIQDASDTHIMGNRFLLSVIAFQRSQQLRMGAKARIDQDGHKPTYVAVLEVLANRISWSQIPAVAPRPPKGVEVARAAGEQY
jgi:DNA-directed RNA polymerase subunit K/omega